MVLWGCPPPRGYLSISSVFPRCLIYHVEVSITDLTKGRPLAALVSTLIASVDKCPGSTFGETKAVLIYATSVVSSNGESYQSHGMALKGDER